MIAVIGDFMIDHYLWGDSHRISPEAPVPVVEITEEEDRLGGAGNAVNSLLSLKSDILISTVLGKGSKRLLDILDDKNIDCSGVFVDDNRDTIIKSRIMSSHQQMIRYDRESTIPITTEYEDMIFEYISQHISNITLMLLSDYEKGVLTNRLTQKLIHLANIHNIKLIIDPKKEFYKYQNAWMLKPNKKELSIATGIDIKTKDDLITAGWSLKEELNLEYLLVTLGEDGMALFGDEYTHIPTVTKEVYDVTGAGDTVLASLGYYLEHHNDIIEAIHFANTAAAIVVGKIGSATVTIGEINAKEGELNYNADYKIIDIKQIANVIESYKSNSQKIVFTNGCFDILHLGHVKYLQKAKALGDVLIVGLNSNDSVKRLKGSSRPINDQYDRAYLLASLQVVDLVIIFSEDTPYNLIQTIQPDILTKGADYKGKQVVGSDLVNDVRLIELVDGRSTSKIIEIAKGKIC